MYVLMSDVHFRVVNLVAMQKIYFRMVNYIA